MPDAVIFPHSLLREQAAQWTLAGVSVSPGRSGTGVQTSLSTDGGGFWTCRLSSVNLRTADHVRAWRAMEGLAQGGAAEMVVPMCDKRQGPFPVVDGRTVYSYGAIPNSDGSLFDDGSGWSQNVIAATASAAALRARSFSVTLTYGGSLRGGEHFSIYHDDEGWRLYRVVSVNGSAITFTPGLRQAIPAGTELDFDNPRCTMRLQDPNAMSLDLVHRKRGDPSASFVEAFFDT